MKLIDADGLNDFAALDASRTFLPWLVRRLLTSEPGIDGVHVPIGVWRPGWDGTVAGAPGSAFVPGGSSAWEFSNNSQVGPNATKNLHKRTESPGEVTPETTTFVFVTMRHWTKKAAWAHDAKAEGCWQDVRVLDSEDLVGWMDLHPGVHRWATQMITSLSRGDAVLGSDLPVDVRGFVGRASEIDSIECLLVDDHAPRTAVVWGLPGSGKTAFTIHTAHLLAEHFPDGRIFLDAASTVSDGARSRGASCASLLRRVLSRLGLESDALPNDAGELAAIYRAELRDHAYLVVIDNVESEAQIRMLDPGHSSSLLLVSSRSRLGGLDAAARIELTRLANGEGAQLLANELGRGIALNEESDANRVVHLCDGLPLALRIAGRMAARHPTWRLGYLAERLGDERERLTRLKFGDVAVRSSFASAYADLPRTIKRVFRRACSVPGRTFTADLVQAAIPDEDLDSVIGFLDDLVDHALVIPLARAGLYKVHDLLRLFGRERFERDEKEPARKAARQGVGRWLQSGLNQTTAALGPRLANVGAGLQTPHLIGASLGWLDNHFENLVAFADALREAGALNASIELILDVAGYCEIRNRWEDLALLADMATSSVDAIRAKGTLNPETAPFVTTTIDTMRAKSAWALRDFENALTLAQEVVAMAPNEVMAAHARLVRSGVFRSLKRTEEALADLRASRAVFAQVGDDVGLEMALHNTGAILTEVGQPRAALRYLKRDLAMCATNNDRLGQAHTMNSMALALLQLHEFDEAEQLLKKAAEICLECYDLGRAGAALNDLGMTLTAKSDHAAAYDCHLQDLIFCEVLSDARGAQRAVVRVAHAMISMDAEYAKPAIKLIEGCIDYATGHDDQELIAAALAVYAEIGYVIKQYDDADRAYDAAALKYRNLNQFQAALTTRIWQLGRATEIARLRCVEKALTDMATDNVFAGQPAHERDLYDGLAEARTAIGDETGAVAAKARADAVRAMLVG